MAHDGGQDIRKGSAGAESHGDAKERWEKIERMKRSGKRAVAEKTKGWRRVILVAVIPASPDHEINILLGVALFPTWRAEKRSLDSQVAGFLAIWGLGTAGSADQCIHPPLQQRRQETYGKTKLRT